MNSPVKPSGNFYEYPSCRNSQTLWLSIREPHLGKRVERLSDYRRLEADFARRLLCNIVEHIENSFPLRAIFMGAGRELACSPTGPERSPLFAAALARPLRESLGPRDGRCFFRSIRPVFESVEDFALYAQDACIPVPGWGENHFLIKYERSHGFTHFVSLSAVIEKADETDQPEREVREYESLPLLLAFSKDGRTFKVMVAANMTPAVSINFEFDVNNLKWDMAQQQQLSLHERARPGSSLRL